MSRSIARSRGAHALRRRSLLRLGLALGLALALSATAQASELRRKEVVGVEPLPPGAAPATPPRDSALRAAVSRAVEDVALAALPSDWTPPAGQPMPVAGSALARSLVPALGDDPFEYASRFRILEDRGARPALLAGPDVEQEYVVLVEVFVDAGRVRERLAAAGWIDGPAGQGPARLRLVVEGLGSWAAYAALRQTLLDDLDVRSALPVEISRGHAVLEIEGAYDPASLQRALEGSERAGLRVVPLERDAASLTVLVDWQPPPPPAVEGGPEGAPPAAAP